MTNILALFQEDKKEALDRKKRTGANEDEKEKEKDEKKEDKEKEKDSKKK